MKQFTHGHERKRLGLVLLVLVVVGSFLLGTCSADDELLAMMPEDTLLCVRLNGLDQALEKLDQYLLGVAPFNISMMAKMQLGGMLGNPQLAELDTRGALAFIALTDSKATGTPPVRFGLLVPVQSFEGFMKASPSFQPASEGVYKLNAGSGKTLLATAFKNYALLTRHGEASELTALKKQLSSGTSIQSSLDQAEVQRATSEPIWVMANTAAVSKVFGSVLQEKVQQASAMMSAMAAMQQGGAMAANPAQTEAATKELFDALSQSRYLAASIAPSAEQLGVDVRLASKPGTALAEKLDKSKTKRDVGLMGFLQDGAAFSLTSNLVGKFIGGSFDSLAAHCPAENTEAKEKATALTAEIAKQFQGASDALSVKLTPGQSPFFTVQYAAQIKDGAKLQEQIGEMAKILGDSLPEGTAAFKLQSAVSEHQGVSIDGATVTPPMPLGSIKQLDYRMAYLDKLFVVTVGSGIEAGIKQLVDKAKAKPGPAPADVTKILAPVEEAQAADLVAAINIAQILQLSPGAGAGQSTPTQSGMAALLNMDKGQATFGLRLPKKHLQEVMQAVQMLMMQRMMKQQPQQQQQ
ncbi:hypothetical protein ACFL6U_19225 [Planctomycetota bacterium]